MAATRSASKPRARKATPRKAAPKKAATQADGAVNGEAVEAAAPSLGTNDAQANQAIDLAPKPENPYGLPEEDLYYYLPRTDGATVIVFPAAHTTKPDRHFLWSIYKKNSMVQGFEWMERAKVPPWIQEQVVMLPEEDYGDFWAGWFKTMVGPQVTPNPDGPPGES
jgi:hypothetical protein